MVGKPYMPTPHDSTRFIESRNQSISPACTRRERDSARLVLHIAEQRASIVISGIPYPIGRGDTLHIVSVDISGGKTVCPAFGNDKTVGVCAVCRQISRPILDFIGRSAVIRLFARREQTQYQRNDNSAKSPNFQIRFLHIPIINIIQLQRYAKVMQFED